MNIVEFLEARIAEDEAQAYNVLVFRMIPETGMPGNQAIPARVLAECAAKRAIISQHQKWPVLVERKPSELEQVAAGLDDITYRMTREMAWLTTREYIKRFGVEPPTAPIIAIMAAVYKEHPDYQQEWAV